MNDKQRNMHPAEVAVLVALLVACAIGGGYGWKPAVSADLVVTQ